MSEKTSNRKEIKDLGEFGLIKHLTKNTIKHHDNTVFGIGDDAAVIQNGTDYQVVSTDMLVEGVHFDLSYTPLKHLGYKSIVVNVSDIAAMNAIPQQVTVSIAISNRFSVDALEELYAGIQLACKRYKVDLVGGDTTSSRSGLIISVTATGLVDKDKVAYRKGAKTGDIVCVTGDLGSAYVGLQTLEREKQVFLSDPDMQPELNRKEYIVERILKPEARMDVIHELRDLKVVPTSMIDVSDGLASELYHLAEHSGVAFHIMNDNVPIMEETRQTAIEFNISPDACAFNGGEDYELLFTVTEQDFDKIKNHHDIHSIGVVTEKENGMYIITKAGNKHELKAQGWTHF